MSAEELGGRAELTLGGEGGASVALIVRDASGSRCVLKEFTLSFCPVCESLSKTADPADEGRGSRRRCPSCALRKKGTTGWIAAQIVRRGAYGDIVWKSFASSEGIVSRRFARPALLRCESEELDAEPRLLTIEPIVRLGDESSDLSTEKSSDLPPSTNGEGLERSGEPRSNSLRGPRDVESVLHVCRIASVRPTRLMTVRSPRGSAKSLTSMSFVDKGDVTSASLGESESATQLR